MQKIGRWLRTSALIAAVTGVAVAIAVSVLRDRRPDIAELRWEIAGPGQPETGSVSATWLGISTLLFDDGETQILVDGTFTRFKLSDLLLWRRTSSNIADINHGLASLRINRLAAIVPVHSHIDHAIDAALIANRTTAVILGSESTANIARGANVPVDQYQILANGESRQFGEFTITLISSKHRPGRWSWFGGTIDEPLRQPARASSWRQGDVYSVVISHPRGTTLVQGSAGYIGGNLEGINADVVMLGIGLLGYLDRDYFESYWGETVLTTGAQRVFPLHFDDFTMPYGELHLLPYVVDDVTQTASWANEMAAAENIPIRMLPLGKPVSLY